MCPIEWCKDGMLAYVCLGLSVSLCQQQMCGGCLVLSHPLPTSHVAAATAAVACQVIRASHRLCESVEALSGGVQTGIGMHRNPGELINTYIHTYTYTVPCGWKKGVYMVARIYEGTE